MISNDDGENLELSLRVCGVVLVQVVFPDELMVGSLGADSVLLSTPWRAFMGSSTGWARSLRYGKSIMRTL